ncbi:MAG: hypothetical protein JW963_04425 [Anaerolineales bacterium]|nr:hypothetical protein [Anaerolineales bacterium]
MYSLYSKIQKQDVWEFCWIENVSLFGCNQGFIPWLLQKSLLGDANEPYNWHINIATALGANEHLNRALIINLKPNSKTPNLSLYELADVWGHSSNGWTPIMIRLRGIFIDENPDRYDAKSFQRLETDIEDPIFSMLYLDGTIMNGSITGKWTPPRASPTNSVLLWPDVFEYFYQQTKYLKF